MSEEKKDVVCEEVPKVDAILETGIKEEVNEKAVNDGASKKKKKQKRPKDESKLSKLIFK